MKIHHLVHNEFGTSNYSQVQEVRSSNIFTLQHADSTKPFREETSSSNKHRSSKIPLDQVSADFNVACKPNNVNDEFYQIVISEDNNKISSITSFDNEEISNS